MKQRNIKTKKQTRSKKRLIKKKLISSSEPWRKDFEDIHNATIYTSIGDFKELCKSFCGWIKNHPSWFKKTFNNKNIIANKEAIKEFIVISLFYLVLSVVVIVIGYLIVILLNRYVLH